MCKLCLYIGVIKLRQELRGGRYRTCIGQSQQTVKYSSRAPGQGACLKGMSRTITMQGFRFAVISDVEKTKLRRKKFQSQWTVKYRSRAPCYGACLKGMSRTITMQGFRLAAISDVEKTKLRRKNYQSKWSVKYRSRAPG